MKASFAITVVLWSVHVVAAAERPTLQELTTKAAIIKPRPDELKWQHIPWLTDVAEAVRLAKQEKRPIFLWATTDEPLERC